MKTAYDLAANGFRGAYVRGPDGEISQIGDLGLHEKHTDFSIRNILTGEECFVDFLCVEEYMEVSKTEVKTALREGEKQIKKTKKGLEGEV